ncbi:MAG: mandelate racemase/muconate lactonizing enzyme family protein [Nitrososphaeria archaeon]
MKIVNIEVIPVLCKLDEPLKWGDMVVNVKGSTLIRVLTDNGIVGVGEAGFSAIYAPWINIHIERLKPLVIGQDPFYVEKIWEEIFSATHMWGRRGMETYAISGIEIALWDIIGKACNRPVYKLLGGFKDKVRCYAAPSLKEPKIIKKECEKFVEEGFTAIKLRTGLGFDEDLAIVKSVRAVVGKDVELMVDANMAYDHNKAIEMSKRLLRYDVSFFEEPVRARSPEEYVREMLRLKKKIEIPLAGGECLFTRYEFGELISKQAVDIVQPDATSVGGLLECKKIGVMASVWGLKCIPHIACSSIPAFGLAANLHVICSLPNSPLIEYDPYDNPLRREIVKGQLYAERGFLKAPVTQGLGLELKEQVLKKYAVSKINP